MCARYIAVTAQDWEYILRVLPQCEAAMPDDGGDVYPSNSAAVLIPAPQCAGIVCEAMGWGFPFRTERVPSKRVINARCETLTQKPMFKSLVQSNRCIVPAHGFYEWEKIGNQKLKYRFHSMDHSPLLMAGLFMRRDAASYFTVITTAANRSVGIHDRMPLILPPEMITPWLFGQGAACGSNNPDAQSIQHLLRYVPQPLQAVCEAPPMQNMQFDF